MSNVIEFLETLGSNPAMTRLSAADYAAAVAALDVDEAQKEALLNGDRDALNGLLGGRDTMLCVVFSPDGDEQKDDEQREQDEPTKDAPESE